MSLESANFPSTPAVPETADDNYVDSILFAEGVYADQQEYEQMIDALADRINRELAVPRGRESREDFDSEGPVTMLSPTKLGDMLNYLSPDLRVVVEMRYLERLSSSEIAKQLGISENQVASRTATALRILAGYSR